MKFLIAENTIVDITKTKAQELGFLKNKPVYVYIVPPTLVEGKGKLYFLSETGKLTDKFKRAKRVNNTWEDFKFILRFGFDCIPARLVNITPYLEGLSEVKT